MTSIWSLIHQLIYFCSFNITGKSRQKKMTLTIANRTIRGKVCHPAALIAKMVSVRRAILE